MHNALIYLRVSSTKQSDKGESLEQQEEVCMREAERRGYKVLQAFKEPYSGRKDSRPALDAMFTYIESDPSVSAVFIRDIDRLTRGGSSSFTQFKRKLSEHGVSLIDCAGIIQEEKNTLAEYGVEYSWSKKSPTRFAENFKADMAQDEVSTMLTRMIGQEIRLVKRGYSLGPAQFGYQNAKKEIEGKKYPIMIPHPEEARYIREMFTLRAEGMADKFIVKRINALGYKSRRYNVRDKKTRKIIGNRGEKPLTVKQLQSYIKKPIYAGVVVGKWTKPVKAQFKGLVSIDFHTTVGSFFDEMGVHTEELEMLEMIAVDQFRLEQLKKVDEIVEVSNNVNTLRLQQKSLLQEMTSTESALVKKMLTEQIESIEQEIKNATEERNKTEVEEGELIEYLHHVKKMFEHPYEFFLEPENKPLLEQYWSMVFREKPTYRSLYVRTPDLSLVAALKRTVESGQVGDGGQGGFSLEHFLNSCGDWFNELLFDVKRFYSYSL